MSKIFSLSASDIGKYSQCEKQYIGNKAQNKGRSLIAKRNGNKKNIPPNQYGSKIGKLIHLTLKDVYSPYIGKQAPVIDSDDLIDILIKHWDKLSNNYQGSIPYDDEKHLGPAISALYCYHNKYLSSPEDAIVYAVERKFLTNKNRRTNFPDLVHPYRWGTFMLKGIMDLILVKDGEFILIDYKCISPSNKNPAIKSCDDYDKSGEVQLAVYSHLLEIETGNPAIEQQLRILSADETIEKKVNSEKKDAVQIASNMLNRIVDVGNHSDKWCESPGSYCKICNVKKFCKSAVKRGETIDISDEIKIGAEELVNQIKSI